MIMKQMDHRREAALRIVETSRLLRSLVEQRLKPYGMTRAQYATLSHLERQDGMAQHEVAERLEVQPIAMVRLVDQLSAEGLVERRPDPADRRCNRLFLTTRGHDRLGELADFKSELGAELFSGIGEDAIRQMLATLQLLHGNIKSIQSAEAASNKSKKAGT